MSLAAGGFWSGGFQQAKLSGSLLDDVTSVMNFGIMLGALCAAALAGRFAPHLGRLTALVHGIFWREEFPRFILRSDLAELWRGGSTPRLRVITDVSCDVGGSNESLLRITDPGDPAYLYDPAIDVCGILGYRRIS